MNWQQSQKQEDKHLQLQIQNIARMWFDAEQRMRAKGRQAIKAEREEK